MCWILGGRERGPGKAGLPITATAQPLHCALAQLRAPSKSNHRGPTVLSALPVILCHPHKYTVRKELL